MKKLFCLLLAVATVFALSACQKSAAAEEPAASSSATPPEVSVSEAEPEVASEVSSELEPEVEANYAFINPLTGEGTETDVSNNRPYAVMMNSLRKAMPQSGNS